MTPNDLTPSSPRFLAAVAKMEEVEKLHPHAPLDALLLAAIPVLLDEPTSGDHDELLARTATHRSDGVGGGVALIRELETALRTEQSARQALQQRIDAALKLKHGPFGPWDDDLVDWASVVTALTAPIESKEPCHDCANGTHDADDHDITKHDPSVFTESKEPDEGYTSRFRENPNSVGGFHD
jgi:hypothetical protein